MPWLLNLQETYDANIKEVGEIKKNRFGKEYTLLPIAHTTQNAHIEVTVTEDGELHSASVIEKEDASTLIPSTVDSASRTSTAVYPYALHDKLNYTAGDFVKYGGKVGKEDPFQAYIHNLANWVNSPFKNEKVEAIYKYVKKGCLIEDLVAEKVLFLDDNKKLIKKWHKQYEALHGEERPPIFKSVTGDQDGAFVRFRVHSPTDIVAPPWRDKEVYNSFVNFYPKQIVNKDVCFVTGKILPSTRKHATKIRHAADKAKLISGNDPSGFTYRGRFNKIEEVANISYDVSQKAHNALKWLIDKQAKVIDQRVFLIWGNNEVDYGDPTDNSYTFGQTIEAQVVATTDDHYAAEFAKALDGYKHSLTSDVHVNILVIDSATTGRMGVLYYRNMDKELYFERIKEWHTTCVWRHSFVQDKQRKFFLGAPATKDIAFAAYGPHANDKLVKGLMERMLTCIVEGARIPPDVIRSAIQRASNPVSMDNWEWEKTLTVTCALVNKEEALAVGLDTENRDRDYLFGRMLAVADVLERSAMQSGEKRATNAIRYMSAFSKHPARTWSTIQDSIQPYQAKLGTRATRYTKIMDEIGSKINIDDFNNKPLTGKYLLGLYSQRHALYTKNDDTKNTDEEVQS